MTANPQRATRTCDVPKVLPHDPLHRFERERDDVWVGVASSSCEHHEHALPPRLDVVHTRKYHLAHTPDDQLTDLNSLRGFGNKDMMCSS